MLKRLLRAPLCVPQPWWNQHRRLAPPALRQVSVPGPLCPPEAPPRSRTPGLSGTGSALAQRQRRLAVLT